MENLTFRLETKGMDALLKNLAKLFPKVSNDQLLSLLHDVIVPTDFIPAIGANNELLLSIDMLSIENKLRAALGTLN